MQGTNVDVVLVRSASTISAVFNERYVHVAWSGSSQSNFNEAKFADVICLVLSCKTFCIFRRPGIWCETTQHLPRL